MKKENLGMKTKYLWKNPDYRRHMSEAHKGQKPWNKGISLNKQISKETNEERKKKISQTLKKLYKSEERKPYWKGKSRSREDKLKQSKTLKELYKLGIIKSRDEGKTSERHRIMQSLNYKMWRLDIFKRDKYTCQMCGNKGCSINAHHIRPFAKYPELRFQLNNGITLCLKCHKEVHKC